MKNIKFIITVITDAYLLSVYTGAKNPNRKRFAW